MEAIVFDGKTLSLKYVKDYPLPKITNDREVIVKVEYAGICGTDLHIIQGHFPSLKERPVILGHENCGVVTEVGSKSIFKVGQKVVIDPNSACNLCDSCRQGHYQYCSSGGINDTIGIWKNGGWAQYVVVPQTQVYALPDDITTKQGGLCEPYSCVAHGFDRASPLKVGQKILVSGAGIIGNLWLTTLHHQGHRNVTVSEMNQKRLDIVKKLKSSKGAQFTNFSNEKSRDEEDFIPGIPECHSLLSPRAHNIIESMKDIYQDVFSDDILLSPTDIRKDPFMAVYQNASSPHLTHNQI